MNNNKAVVLIFHHSSQLKWYEEISLRQCFRVLHKYPIRLVCPEGMDLTEIQKIVPQIVVEPVPKRWMSSLKQYNRMKMLPQLYRKYENFEFMLTYELDAFVFRDDLDIWCTTGYDYIGAPWIETNSDPEIPIRSKGVGNSGFSLRNIHSALRALNSFGLLMSPSMMAKQTLSRGNLLTGITKFLFRSACYNTHWTLNRFPYNEDRFWSYVGNRRAWFKMSPFEEAASFSFERGPEQLFYCCKQQLPFGCHAWAKYELDFWRPHIEAQGFKIP